jgi:hypothetical protein
MADIGNRYARIPAGVKSGMSVWSAGKLHNLGCAAAAAL